MKIPNGPFSYSRSHIRKWMYIVLIGKVRIFPELHELIFVHILYSFQMQSEGYYSLVQCIVPTCSYLMKTPSYVVMCSTCRTVQCVSLLCNRYIAQRILLVTLARYLWQSRLWQVGIQSSSKSFTKRLISWRCFHIQILSAYLVGESMVQSTAGWWCKTMVYKMYQNILWKLAPQLQYTHPATSWYVPMHRFQPRGGRWGQCTTDGVGVHAVWRSCIVLEIT